MLKKLVVTGGAGLLVMGFLFGNDAFSYLATSVGVVKNRIDDSVPVTFQIERARQMIDKIEPEVYRNKSMIVKEEVAVDRLQQRIARLEDKQVKEESNIMKMKNDLDTGEKYIYYTGHRYTSSQVRSDLENRFSRFKTRDEELKHLRTQLAQQEKVLTAARGKLDEMLAKRSKLIAEVSKLEAQEKMLSVAKSASEIQIDDSTIASVRELVDQIDARLAVETRMLDADETFTDEIPVEESSSENVSEAIAAYFGQEAPEAETLAEVEVVIDDSNL